MKKVLIGLLVVVMVLSLTACSQELADLMGKMSNNVYGIPADTSAADEATANVDNAVEKDEDGKVTVTLSTAAAITSSISEIKSSPAKTEALKSQLSETVASTPEEGADVKDAIVAAASDAAKALADAVGDNEIVAEIQNTLNNIASSISDNPTKAELATVAVLSEVATTAANVAKSGAENLSEEDVNALVNQGLAAYDTLVIVTEVANIDVLGDLDIASLLSSVSKDVSRDDDNQFNLGMFKTSISKILGMVTKDGKFNDEKYKSFIFQAKAIKASMDTIAMAFSETDPNAILDKKIDCGLTIDSFGLYLVCSIFVEVDKLGVLPSGDYSTYISNGILTEELTTANHWQNFAADYVNTNYEALSNLGGDTKPADPNDQLFMLFALALDTNIDGNPEFVASLLDPKASEIIATELKTDMKTAIGTPTQSVFTADIFNILRTAAVIIVDAEYKGILSLGDGDGTITGLLNMIK